MTSNHKFSLAHLTLLDCPPPELLRIAARTGYDFVGLRLIPMDRPGEPSHPVARDRSLLRKTKEALTETGVGLLDIEVAQIRTAFDRDMYLPEFEAAAELGAMFVVVSVWTSNRALAIEAIGALCDIAKPLGLTMALEFMSFSSIASLRQAIDVVRECSRSNLGILIDTLHLHHARTELGDLKEVSANMTPYAHVCDGPWQIPSTPEARRDIAREQRLFPGEGGIDLASVLKLLPRNLTYALEIANPARSRDLGAEVYARRALETARLYVDAHLSES